MSVIMLSFWIADAINNAAGFGFNGYDSDGLPRWDLISNLRVMNIEVSQATVNFLELCQNESDFLINPCLLQCATSFKVFLDNWNIQTAHWLKRYEQQEHVDCGITALQLVNTCHLPTFTNTLMLCFNKLMHDLDLTNS